MTTLGCGLRLGEIIGLKWENIDFEKETINIKSAISNIAKVENDGSRTWSIVEHTPKTDTSIRTIPMPKSLVAALKLHKAAQNKEKLKHGELYTDYDLVFCTECGNYYDTRNLTRSYTRHLKK